MNTSVDSGYGGNVFQGHPDSVDVIVQDFSISIVNTKDSSKNKEILHPISTVIEGGTLFAILGGSGSGKTTLLNVIAGRYSARQLDVGGEIRFGSLKKCSIGYVTQQDYLLPNLTVKETLLFAARMKVDPNTAIPAAGRYKIDASNGSKMDIYTYLAEEVIQDLGLKECADSLVGDNSGTSQLAGGHRGLSGGERRRVSIAIQIISDCKVLCADEPTSGLDSFTAITVVEALHRLTRGAHHTTVISSIHQPRADVFHLFDGVLLLSKGGHAVYCGTTKAMVKYFKQLGYDCPRNSNPADYFVDLSAVDSRSAKDLDESQARVDKLVAAFAESQMRMCLSYNTHVSEEPPPSPLPRLSAGGNSRKSQHAAPSEAYEFRPSWYAQVYFLVGRFFRNNFRDLPSALGGVIQAMVLGLILMVIFWQLSDSLADIETRNGLLYIVVSTEYYILTIILVERYCTELKVFDRELQDALYEPSAYLTAHILSSAPLLIIQPVLYALPIYYGCNLREGAPHVLMYVAVNITLSFVINGIVWMCVSISRDFTIASLLANMNFTFISLTAGFLVNYNDIPIYVSWVRYLSFCSYAYRILMSNEYSDRTLPGCTSPNPVDCIQYDGNYILDTQDIAVHDYETTWIALGVLCVGYHAIAYVNLHFVRHPVTGIVGSDITVDDENIGRYSVAASPIGADGATGGELRGPVEALLSHDESYHRTPVSITINGVYLAVHATSSNSSLGSLSPISLASPSTASDPHSVQSPDASMYDTTHSSGRTSRDKDKDAEVDPSGLKVILRDITASVQPGRLVALMGGSGSGKTTLLNLIAGRISPRCLQADANQFGNKSQCWSSGGSGKYEGCGEILFNNTVPSGAKLRELIGYVQQFDFHLPSLTVKETLMFHANLRLLQGTDPLKRQQRVQQVLSTLDLHQCAQTRVGDAELKGISGGEKRRLSLGVQLLADPAVCLLDEPTTGLDAFTARHVVQTLQQLAHKGRTVVVSIHQPRYDVFALLDDVILLARGRLVWSGNSADMLKHFAALGQPCPPLTNPADFILDISSVDFRSEEKENESKERLRMLLQGRESYVKHGLSVHTYADGFDFDDEEGSDSASNLSRSMMSNSALSWAFNASPGRQSRGPSRVTSRMGRDDEAQSALQNLRIEEIYPEVTPSPLSSPRKGPSLRVAVLSAPRTRKRTLTSESNFATSVDVSKPLYFTLPLLLRRSFLNMSRQPALCLNRISQGMFFGLILACFYAPVGDDQNSIQDRVGNLYELTALCFIGMLSCIAIFPSERNVFYREYVDGDYSALAFFMAYFIIAIPFLIVTALGISALMVFAVGLEPTFSALITFTGVVFSFIFAGECVGVIFCSLFMHVGFSVNIMSVVISIFGIMAGYISLDMPIELRYISYISPVTWGAYVLSNEVFQQKTFTCDPDERDSQGECPISTGEEVLALYDMDGGSGEYGVNYHLMMLAIVSSCFFLLTFLVVRGRAYKLSH